MVQNFAYFILLLGVLVTVHEAGHFLVAKACNVKVLKFSIGFGPRIFGFTRGETEYRVAWIPLGGFVKMAGELPFEELPPEEAKRGFLAQPPWKRGLIVAAGPAFNLIFPILLYFFVFLGSHDVVGTRVGSVEPGLPASVAGVKPGDRIVAIDGKDVRTFEEVMRELQTRYDRDIQLRVERAGEKIDLSVHPRKTEESNPIETIPRGLIGISPGKPPLLGVPAGSVAESAGLKTFDRVLKVNGEPVKDEASLILALNKTAPGPVALTLAREEPLGLPGAGGFAPRVVEVSVERQSGEGQALVGAERADLYIGGVVADSPADRAGLKPGDRLVAFNGKPLESSLVMDLTLRQLKAQPFELTWRSGTEEKTQKLSQVKTELKDEFKQTSEILDLGLRARRGPNVEVEPEMVTLRMGPGQALGVAFETVPDIIVKTAKVILMLFTGDVPFKSVGGPLMLYDIAAKTAEQGWEQYLNAMAVISVNLGLMNLLPIPVLDGFHLLAALWEGVRRRPIPLRAREVANMVGLAMLVLLMVMVIKNDITR
jgi:regulator of sigma E protease